MYTIYCIKSLATGALLYVGCTKRYSNRKSDHRWRLKNRKHPIPEFQAHVDKYGIADLQFEIVGTCETKVNAMVVEATAIKSWRPLFNRAWNKSGMPKSLRKLEMI